MAHVNEDALESLLSSPADDKNAIPRRRNNRRSSPPATTSFLDQTDVGISSLAVITKPAFRKVFIFLGAYLGIGSFGFSLIMNQIKGEKTNGILDALYFSVVTMTTVGYGDLVPDSTTAKLLASLYVFAGMALVGLILGQAADYLVDKQEMLLIRALHLDDQVGPSEIETNKVKYKFLTTFVQLLVLVIVGIMFLMLVESFNFVDALYCVCATITTLGYGDESFSSSEGRFFAIFWILGSTICLAQFYLYLAEMYSEKRQRSLVKWVLGRKVTTSDLEAADLDHDKVVR